MSRTEATPAEQPVIRFGVFELDPSAGELRKSGVKVRLQEQPFQILSLLLERPGKVVTREEIQQKLWPEGTFVDFEHSLNAAVKRLREALGDSADNPQFVETVPRRGYRFIYPVEGHQAKRPPWVWAMALAALPALLAVLLALNVGGLRHRLWPRASSSAERVMLGVLPFDNLSGDPEQEYFSDGMTEEMIAQLGRLQPARLGVIARTSAMHYKGTDKRVDEIGRELGVDYILEGSVRREAEQVRITAQLIQVSDQTQLWAENYQRNLKDILALQSDIAQRIARSLEVKLLPAERARPSGAGTINPEAYEAYLKGRYFWNKRTEEGIKKSLDSFQQAVARDPNYALAYSGLADAYAIGIFVGYLPSEENRPKGLAAALRAVELDDTLAEAHASLANFEIGNWLVEEKELQRAIELNPNYAPAHQWYAMNLSARGRHEEALAEGKKALELDPLSMQISDNVALLYCFLHRYDEAIETLRRALELDPNFFNHYRTLGYVYRQKGMYEEAISAYQKALELAENHATVLSDLGYCYAVAGRRGEALKILGQLQELSKQKYVAPLDFAIVYIGLGEKGQAFAWLEKAYEEGPSELIYLKVGPWFDPLRDDPRFQDLLRRMNFPE